MRRRFFALALFFAAAVLGARPFPCVAAPAGYAQRSVSSSRQFIVYCADIRLRLAVTGFVETAKAAVLETLGLSDHWKLPIVITLRAAPTAAPGLPPSQLQLISTEGGMKVEINVFLREGDLREARFPQTVVQAVLTEIAYRGQTPEDGSAFHLPPPWLVEGITEQLRQRAAERGANAALFRQLIERGHLPKIRDFLATNTAVMDSTSRSVYAACSLSLLEMLAELPRGRASMAGLVAKIPDLGDAPVRLLLESYPALGKNEAALEKWWTLAIARFSAADRYRAATVAETNGRLAPLLTFEIVTDPKKETKTRFGFAEFKSFVKLKAAEPVLLGQAAALAALLPNAHPLMRPVILEYQRIALLLAKRKTRGVQKSLEEVEQYRGLIVERMEKIGDYLNWFEATQMPGRSGAFDAFLKAARASANPGPAPRLRDDPISRYLDQVEREF